MNTIAARHDAEVAGARSRVRRISTPNLITAMAPLHHLTHAMPRIVRCVRLEVGGPSRDSNGPHGPGDLPPRHVVAVANEIFVQDVVEKMLLRDRQAVPPAVAGILDGVGRDMSRSDAGEFGSSEKSRTCRQVSR